MRTEPDLSHEYPFRQTVSFLFYMYKLYDKYIIFLEATILKYLESIINMLISECIRMKIQFVLKNRQSWVIIKSSSTSQFPFRFPLQYTGNMLHTSI